jgi:uncharacterized repeat protein (TIGR01451 family)
VAFRADGSAQYLPTTGFSGIDTFRYVVTDPATGLSTEAAVTVTVLPRAVDDRAATGEGLAVTVVVLGNDSCTACTVTIEDDPVAGAVSVNGNGSIAYEPDGTFAGTDQFVYRITDPATTRHAEATVTVVVSNATDDAATTPSGTAVDVAVLANDTFCSSCTVQSAGVAGHGTASLLGNGSIRYEPADGFWGLDAFTYTTAPGSPATATVRILVAPPVRQVSVATNGTADGTLLDTAPCSGCLFTVVGGPTGDLSLVGSGVWSYTAPATALVDTVSYQVHDPLTGLTVTGSLVITVAAPPPPTAGVSLTKTAGSIADANSSSRVDAGDTVAYTYVVSNSGTVTLTTVTVTDDRIDPSTVAACGAGGNVIASLGSGSSVTCHATWTLVQADIDAGSVTSTGTAGAANPLGGSALSDSDPVVITVARTNGIAVAVSLTGRDDVDSSGKDSAGDRLDYSVVATNTGTTTLAAVTITDPPTGATKNCGPLAPGATCILTTSFTLTQADLDRGTVTNTAAASGTGPGTADVSDDDSHTTSLHIATAPEPGPTDPGPTLPGPTDPGPATGYTVSGVIWFDLDHDGVHDSAEPVLPGATVTLEPARSPSARRSAAATPTTTVTGSDGRYRFGAVAPGSYSVVAHATAAGLPSTWDSDGATDWNVALTVTDADAVADFASTGSGSVTGTVTERSTGAAIPGAAIACTWPGLDGLAGTADDVTFTTTSAGDGSFAVASAPFGTLACTATDVTSGENQTFTAAITAAAPVRAEVVLGRSAGAPSTGGRLPATGDDPRRYVYPSLTLLAAGLTLLAATRRSTPRPTQ